ncbi:MAG: hypothetical protein JRJ12_16820 [Deltaproteobacteria bacterium]|nr:hypothetical protein [Deltaproteobacteria bacterium]MBW2071067.1 hypothetical protein [Deltaproteobacteria bacterium]
MPADWSFNGSQERHNFPRQMLAAKLERTASLPPKKRLQVLLTDLHSRELVQAMAEEDFYFMFKELGAQDALPLLELASAEQRQYLLDLELWRRDRFAPDKALEWLSLLNECGEEAMKQWLRETDPGFICLILKNFLRVYKAGEEESSHELLQLFTVDQVYYLDFLVPESRDMVARMVQALAAENLLQYHNILEEIHWNILAELEESQLHFRRSRLAEKGFPDLDEALSVYDPLEMEEFRDRLVKYDYLYAGVPAAAPVAPTYPLLAQPEHTFLRAVLEKIDSEPEVERLRREFAALANQVMVADGIVPEDSTTITANLSKVSGYLSVALEALSNGDLGQARELLRKAPVGSLFQVAVGVIFETRRQADRLVISWLRQCGLPIEFLGEPWTSQLQGLLQKRPKRYVGGTAGEPLYDDFSSHADVLALDGVVQLAHLVGEVVKGLLPVQTWPTCWRRLQRSMPESTPLVTWKTAVLTAFVHNWQGEEFVLQPLELRQVIQFLGELWEPTGRPRRVARQIRQQFCQWLSALARRDNQQMAPLCEILCGHLEEELGDVSEESLQRRYLQTLFLVEP